MLQSQAWVGHHMVCQAAGDASAIQSRSWHWHTELPYTAAMFAGMCHPINDPERKPRLLLRVISGWPPSPCACRMLPASSPPSAGCWACSAQQLCRHPCQRRLRAHSAPSRCSSPSTPTSCAPRRPGCSCRAATSRGAAHIGLRRGLGMSRLKGSRRHLDPTSARMHRMQVRLWHMVPVPDGQVPVARCSHCRPGSCTLCA